MPFPLLDRSRRVGAGGALFLVLSSTVTLASAQPNPPAPDGGGIENPAPVPEPLPVLPKPATPPTVVAPPIEPAPEVNPITGDLYGFIEERLEAVGAEPNGDINADGTPSRSRPSLDLAIPAFHIMAQGTLYARYRYYFNLSAPDADQPTFDTPVAVRNAWLEMSIFGDYLNLRVGKLYRRFGLYNEILDTIPSFIGVETPVSISGDRPMLTRTTNAMVHGKVSFGDHTVAYAATAGKDEASPEDDVWSPGFDLRYDWNSTILIGSSYYNTAGTVGPDVALGQGAPSGGVAPWMAHDRYQVYGAFARLTLGSFLLQGEGWISPHHSVRDPERVLLLAQNAQHFSEANRQRMGVVGSTPTADQVITGVDYTYQTIDVRAAYTFEVGGGAEPMEVTPYLNFEYVFNRESISDPDYGGDGEPGESPRGRLIHNRVGFLFKPVPVVCLKTEFTAALYDYGDQLAWDPEVFLSLSYQWQLIHK
jgi:hypothetical protein